MPGVTTLAPPNSHSAYNTVHTPRAQQLRGSRSFHAGCLSVACVVHRLGPLGSEVYLSDVTLVSCLVVQKQLGPGHVLSVVSKPVLVHHVLRTRTHAHITVDTFQRDNFISVSIFRLRGSSGFCSSRAKLLTRAPRRPGLGFRHPASWNPPRVESSRTTCP